MYMIVCVCVMVVGGPFLEDAMTASVQHAAVVLLCFTKRYRDGLKGKAGKCLTTVVL